jgi:hypothetical protein
MENDIVSMLLLMEKTIKNDCVLYKNNQLHIADKYYSKIVLTPLIIDFWYENMKYKELFCGKESTYKPVTEQATDLFRGIKEYKNYNEKENNTMLFEVYPFLGLNTSNYPLETEDDQLDSEEKNRLHKIMGKYFKDYTKTEPKTVQENHYNCLKRMLKKYFENYAGSEAELYKNFGQNDGAIKSLKSNFFAGIKVYPPLGFDPWPGKNKEQMERVIYLYDYCQRKGIPITTHCSDYGFRVIDPELALENCNPLKWENVLKEFPKLKLNLAHFGKRKKFFKSALKYQRNLWHENILHLIKNHENVYADFADSGDKNSFYKSLKKLIDKQDEKDKQKLKEHILFGSDYFINLQSIDSYNDYLKKYSQCVLHDEDKDKFCRINPQRFLFKD